MKSFLLVVTFLILALVIPGIIISESDINYSNGLLALPLLIELISSLKIINILKSLKKTYMRLFFWLFSYIMFGVSPIVQISGSWFWNGTYSPNEIILAYGLILLGFVSFEFGYKLNAVFSNKNYDVIKRHLTDDHIEQKYITGLGFALIVILFAIFFLVNSHIPFTSFFSYRTSLNNALNLDNPSSAYFNLFTRFLPLLTLLWLIWDLKYLDFPKKLTKYFYFEVLILSVIIIITSNYRVAARFIFGTLILSIFIALYGDKKITPFILALGVPIGLLVIFPYLNSFRGSNDYQTIKWFFSSKHWVIGSLANGDFDSLQQIMNIIRFVKSDGIRYGNQLLGLFTFWIPRSLWQSKPIPSGQLSSLALGYRYTNLSSPLWVEGYIDFGVLGTVIYLIIWGYLCFFLDKNYKRPKSSRINWPTFVLWLMVPAQLFFLRGSLSVAVIYFIPEIIFSIIWQFVFQGSSIKYPIKKEKKIRQY